MKLFFTVLMSGLVAGVFAQTPVEVSMGEGYANDVFVSLENGEVSTVDATGWHLAFDLRSSFSDGIRINDGHGVALSLVPDVAIEDWADVDSTGFYTWDRLQNETTSWARGAFNVSAGSDPFDFSWGVYTGDPLHDVVGDSLYIIQLPDESAKKLRIDLLDGGVWTFTHANLDGTEETQVTLDMADYEGKNFLYYNLLTGDWTDREPLNTDWDLVFTRFYGMTAFGPGATAGCLANDGVALIEVDGEDPGSVSYVDYPWITDDISVIGNDWKQLNDAFMWEVTPERTYFAQNAAGDVYQITFTSFEGTSNGNLSYNVTLISGASVTEQAAGFDLNVFPNPTSGVVNLTWEASQQAQTTVLLTNSVGQAVRTQTVTGILGTNTQQLTTTGLQAGLYHLSLITSTGRVTRTLVVQSLLQSRIYAHTIFHGLDGTGGCIDRLYPGPFRPATRI